MTTRRGMTLIELLVVITILAIATSVSSVAFRNVSKPVAADARRQLAALRSEAIRRGAPSTRLIQDSSLAYVATALPDGRMLVDSTRAEANHAAH